MSEGRERRGGCSGRSKERGASAGSVAAQGAHLVALVDLLPVLHQLVLEVVGDVEADVQAGEVLLLGLDALLGVVAALALLRGLVGRLPPVLARGALHDALLQHGRLPVLLQHARHVHPLVVPGRRRRGGGGGGREW